jgi:hypothetical protein
MSVCPARLGLSSGVNPAVVSSSISSGGCATSPFVAFPSAFEITCSYGCHDGRVFPVPRHPPDLAPRSPTLSAERPGGTRMFNRARPVAKRRIAWLTYRMQSRFSKTYTLAPAIGLEPITCRLTEGLSWPGSARPAKVSSPLHLHKCLSGAYRVILAVVPPCAGECRFVRVVPVLIFPGGPACVGFVLATKLLINSGSSPPLPSPGTRRQPRPR